MPQIANLKPISFQVSQINVKELSLILGCISSALVLRLLTAFLVALANDLSIKESLFIAITWIPKAIVEVRYLFYTSIICGETLFEHHKLLLRQRICLSENILLILSFLYYLSVSDSFFNSNFFMLNFSRLINIFFMFTSI